MADYGCAGLTAVITGGTSGLGLAAAKLLAADGAAVYILGRNEERGAKALVEAKAAAKNKVTYIRCDVEDKRACEKAMAAAAESGPIHLLLTSAGFYREGPLQNIDDEAFDAMMAVNVKGTFYAIAAALPYFGENAAVCTVASDAGLKGNRNCPLYCASKGAVVALTKALALDLAPRVRVNCVCPGDADTPLAEAQLVGAPYSRADMEAVYPLGRIAKAEEVAHVICSLLSPANGFMTGSIVSVDGGLTA